MIRRNCRDGSGNIESAPFSGISTVVMPCGMLFPSGDAGGMHQLSRYRSVVVRLAGGSSICANFELRQSSVFT